MSPVSMVTLDGLFHRHGVAGNKPLLISPALYATPDPAELASSSLTCISPSPYVLNHKRRDRPVRADAERAPIEAVADPKSLGGSWDGEVQRGVVEDGDVDQLDPFFDSRETGSVAGSSCDLGDYSSRIDPSASEFYDADEEFLSDGSTSSPLRPNIELEVATEKLNLLEEIERRKKAEEDVLHMETQWNNAASCLSQIGLSFPPLSVGQKMQDIDDSINQVCQEVVISRFVSNALERGIARAEAEASAEKVILSKNREISRLHDRLQYYEAVNREMCQRNQEVVELARQHRRRRQRQQRWMWTFVGFSLTIGVSWMAYSYAPHFMKGSSTPPGSDLISESVESTND